MEKVKIDLSIERRHYYDDEIVGSNCPECDGLLIARNATVMLYVVSKNDEAPFMTNAVGSAFCYDCPVVVFEREMVVEAATLAIRGEVEGYGIAGIIDLDAIPKEKANMELGTDENPVPLVGFLPDRKQQPVIVGAKTGRNAPCPCGSGKKYKRCCAKK